MFTPHITLLVVGTNSKNPTFYVRMTFDKQFKWLAQGHLTLDAFLFVIGLIIACLADGIHLNRHKHDFVSAGNSVLMR